MPQVEKIANGLFALFLLFCAGVHIYGLAMPFSSESVASHIAHLLSYLLCLYGFAGKHTHRKLIYFLAMLYPVAFHAVCAYSTYVQQHRLNGVCVLVVVALPMGWWWMNSNLSRVTPT